MTTGFEEAQERRNWLERLMDKIPGFRGFQDRELRREVDKLQREHLAKELGQIKLAVRGKAQAYTDAGQIGALYLFGRMDGRLDGLSQAIRFADYGQSGFFDVVKINEPELDAIYQFDLSLVEDIGRLAGDVVAIPLPGQGDAQEACNQALAHISTLADKWTERKNVISGVVQTDG
jgi:hypothetical protein